MGLHTHLVASHAKWDRACFRWFSTYFMCLDLDHIERLWDRVLVVSVDFLAFIGCGILIANRKKLMQLSTASAIEQFFLELPDRNVDIWLRKAREIHESSSKS
eukprot:TRINITY_DN2537_c1_g1_i1.p1 TRINITY_DN2537_c1_g1~~TRINITY_DN2537_c1_g1_i1.p1  ORF type:complete len:113 (-),score=26.86 TRINITY_DN2537_c1_g1_i1:40-348(-)